MKESIAPEGLRHKITMAAAICHSFDCLCRFSARIERSMRGHSMSFCHVVRMLPATDEIAFHVAIFSAQAGHSFA